MVSSTDFRIFMYQVLKIAILDTAISQYIKELRKQECILVGCVPSAAVAVRGGLPGRCLPGGCLPGEFLPGDVCPGGVCLGGLSASGSAQGGDASPGGVDTPPREQNHRQVKKTLPFHNYCYGR